MKVWLLGAYLLVLMGNQMLDWLNLRHQKRHAGRIPEAFRRHIDAATATRALAYESDRKRLALIENALLSALFALFLFGGWLPRYDAWLDARTSSFIGHGLLFLFGLILARTLLEAPFSCYMNFRVEARYGFNTMSLRLWLADLVKTLVLCLLLYGMLAAGALWLVQASPDRWWLWVWGFVTLFALFVMVLSPLLIEPLFFKFSPIAREGLEQRIRQLADKAGLHAGRIFQVDASRRSRHGNAYFTGLGRQKRIVLFDTLLQSMDDGEILAILAHEIGHWKHRHIVRRLAVSAALTLAGLYLAFWLIRWGGLPGLLDLPAASFMAQVLILSLLSAIVSFPLAPLANTLARRQERQADRFACRLTGRPLDLAEALIKLARDNLAALHPHPLYAWFRFPHPPIAERVRKLRAQTNERAGQQPSGNGR